MVKQMVLYGLIYNIQWGFDMNRDKAIAVAVRFMFSNVDCTELEIYQALEDCDDDNVDVDTLLESKGIDAQAWCVFEQEKAIEMYNLIESLADDICDSMK